MLDYIIVGQGIAGSLLGIELLNSDKKILVIADLDRPSSSQVAGGMYNPVTGKHLAKTWLADDLYPFLDSYYKALELKLKANFFHPTTIYRPYVNQQQKEQFIHTITKHEIGHFVKTTEEREQFSPFIQNPLGGIVTKHGGWIDVPILTKACLALFQSTNSFSSEIFDYSQLQVFENKIIYKGKTAQNIVFCEGFYATQNPYFAWLPFNPVKGETLIAKMEDYSISEIINQNSWIMPIGDKRYRFGATYSWHELDFINTERAKADLLVKVGKYLRHPFEICAQQAGVRPATKDRRPIMGRHPNFKNVLIFNGLGTKGVSIAPYFTVDFVKYLNSQKELHSETTIERYYALY